MPTDFLQQLEELLLQRKNNPASTSYTATMLAKPLEKTLQKVGEEAVEYILDSMKQDRQRSIEEGADLLFHFLLSLVRQGIGLNEIINELKRRQK